MEYTNNTPIQALMESTFDSPMIFQARKMVEQGRVSLSFMKGTYETYFIVSGITAENNTNYESKISFKRNEEAPDGRLVTTCTCKLWNTEKSCHHAAALLIKFSDIQDKQEPGTSQRINLSLMAQEGVHV